MPAVVALALGDTLAALNDQIAATNQHLTELEQERAAVSAALTRFASNDHPTGSNTGRVLAVLQQAHRPLSIRTIAASLHLTTTQTRTAVGYLHRLGKVRCWQRGVWEVVQHHSGENGAGDAPVDLHSHLTVI